LVATSMTGKVRPSWRRDALFGEYFPLANGRHPEDAQLVA
jgi:hypothetical protein